MADYGYLYKIEFKDYTYVGQSVYQDYLGRLVQHICSGYGAPFVLTKQYQVTKDGVIINQKNKEENKDKESHRVRLSSWKTIIDYRILYETIASLGAYQAQFFYTKFNETTQKDRPDGYNDFQTVWKNSATAHKHLDYAEIMAIHLSQRKQDATNTEHGAQGSISLNIAWDPNAHSHENPLLRLSEADLIWPKKSENAWKYLQYPSKLLADRCKAYLSKPFRLPNTYIEELTQKIREILPTTIIGSQTMTIKIKEILATALQDWLDHWSEEAQAILNNLLANTKNKIRKIISPTVTAEDHFITEWAEKIAVTQSKKNIIKIDFKNAKTLDCTKLKWVIQTSSAHDDWWTSANTYFTNPSLNEATPIESLQWTNVTEDVKIMFLTNLIRYYHNNIASLAAKDSTTGYNEMRNSMKKDSLWTKDPSASLTQLINFYYDQEQGYGRLIIKAKETIKPETKRPRDFTKIFQPRVATTQPTVDKDVFVMSRTGLTATYGRLTKTDAEWLKKNQPQSLKDITKW